jgi:tetratricopeptide (TPR) repeat protein
VVATIAADRERLSAGLTRDLLEVLAAQLEVREGRAESGVERMRAVAAANPDEHLFKGVLIRTLLRLDRGEEALRFAQDSVRAHPDDPGLHSDLVLVYEMLGRRASAEKLLREHIRRWDSPQQRLRLARVLESTGDRLGAADAYSEALDHHPDSVQLRLGQIHNLLVLQDLGAAERALDRFGSADRGNPHVDYLWGRLHLARGRTSEAVERLRRAVGDLDREFTQYWLGRALEASGDLEGAMRRYALASLREPAGREPLEAMARLAAARGDWWRAVEVAHRLMVLDPEEPAHHEQSIAGLLHTGRAQEAENASLRYRALFPDERKGVSLQTRALVAQGRLDEADGVLKNGGARFGVGPDFDQVEALILTRRGEHEDALAVLRRALSQQPNEASHHAIQAEILRALGEWDRADAAVERALELAPGELGPLERRGLARGRAGDYEGALADFERYLHASPHDARVVTWIGDLQRRLGRSEEAIESFRRAIELSPIQAAPFNDLALLMAERGDREDALRLAQKAYALSPDSPEVLDTLGLLYLEEGLLDRSVALLERAQAGSPEPSSIQLHLALAYQAAQRDEDARTLLADLLARARPGSELRAQAHDALGTMEN